MNIIGADFASAQVTQSGYFIKAVANEAAVVFFPGATEHRTVKRAGLSYEDDYKGNALALVITEGRIEVRNHRDFSMARVRAIHKTIQSHPDLISLKEFRLRYGSRNLV